MAASRLRLAALPAVALAVALATTALLAGGAGAGGESEGALAWQGETTVFSPQGLSGDRIVTGRVVNVSGGDLELDAAQVTITAGDAQLRSTARFASAFAHGLMSPAREGTPGEGEQQRLGVVARLEPGQSAPLTLSWRTEPGAGGPLRARFGDVGLGIPPR